LQFVYCVLIVEHHSTETALLYIHDHLINAKAHKKVSCLCLLDLSTAFDTIDHNILLTRPSWFGIQGSALDWFKSSRSFRIKCNNNFSSCHSCICGVPQGSFLGPLLFILYTTPLSTLISSLSVNHHLYADDSQLFFSFYPSVFDSSITQLQHSLQQISSWMTANLLSLSSSKAKFLLVGLPQQLAKINTSSLIYYSLCSQPWFYLWWTPHFLWPNICCDWILLLSYSWNVIVRPTGALLVVVLQGSQTWHKLTRYRL